MSEATRDSAGCTVYLFRHGDSSPDAVPRYIGSSEFPLNDRGRAQAEWWHRELAEVPFSAIHCSDLARSIDTARIIGGDSQAPFTIMPELREIDLGSWDGLPRSDVRERFPQEYARRGEDPEGFRPPEGESFSDVANRVLPAFERVVEKCRGNVLVVAHAGVNRVILSHVLGMPIANLFRLEQGYGCLNVLKSTAGEWVVRAVNVLPRLEEGTPGDGAH